MLFNSYIFLFGFLPVALLGYEIAGRFHRRAVVAWLGFASLAFYAYWRPAFVLVLISSILFNFGAAELISRSPAGGSRSRWLLTAAIVGNLGALAYFKYLFPVLNFVSYHTGWFERFSDVLLPLGISFFTFTQIAFLVDLQQGVAKQQDILSYVLFVTFFPHLIAGPILHHKEMMPQFQQDRRYRLSLADVSVGLSWFVMGLGKKVLIADHFAIISNEIFRHSHSLHARAAWCGALSYALQLYFDFSGYSDMALGLARMFSINFPLNFNSPYKAHNIIDFWQRWHITLSQYITTYVYSPLQFSLRRRRRASGKPVNREALETLGGFATLIAFPMIFTMSVAGVWHGAGLTFVVYGLLHGAFLTINHAWNIFSQRRAAANLHTQPHPLVAYLSHGGSVLLTFLCVLITLVFFRANSLSDAVALLRSMVHSYGSLIGPPLDDHIVASNGMAVKIAAGLFVCWFLPNTQQLLSAFHPSLHPELVTVSKRWSSVLWRPGFAWSFTLGCVLLVVLIQLQRPATFLYFQF